MSDQREFVTVDFGYKAPDGQLVFITDFGRLRLKDDMELWRIINREAQRRWEAGEVLENTRP